MDTEKNNDEKPTKKAESEKKLKARLYANLMAQGGTSILPGSVEGRRCSFSANERVVHSVLNFLVDELRNPESKYYKEYCVSKNTPEDIIKEADSMVYGVE